MNLPTETIKTFNLPQPQNLPIETKTFNLIQPLNSSIKKGPNWLKIAKYGGPPAIIVGAGLLFGGKWLYNKINNRTNENSKFGHAFGIYIFKHLFYTTDLTVMISTNPKDSRKHNSTTMIIVFVVLSALTFSGIVFICYKVRKSPKEEDTTSESDPMVNNEPQSSVYSAISSTPQCNVASSSAMTNKTISVSRRKHKVKRTQR